MRYYSTNHTSPEVTFSEALLRGQAPDRGLYMPENLPHFSEEELSRFKQLEYHEIAAIIIGKFLDGEISVEILSKLTYDAYNFEIPLEHVYARHYVMRLDQGPTASFKDFAARMMGRLMNYYLQKEKRHLLILTATSGDTGSAVAHAFLGLDRIKVVVLFPEGEVTERQRKQMTTLGRNIQVISMKGKFDDCQALVKQAFADPVLAHLPLSSANSINIGRLIPQSVYYVYAWSRLATGKEKIIFSVPSGNFGDMMGGMLAMKMGLPIEKFIIAVNANDEFPVFLRTGRYQKIEPSRNCISSAMNVGHPSNLARLLSLYGGVMDETGLIHKPADLEALNKDVFAVSVSDEDTRNTMLSAWEKYRLVLEPHGAVGWYGLHKYIGEYTDQLSVTLETAHPAKFPGEIQQLLGFDPDLPASLTGLEEKTEQYLTMETDYQGFRDFLLTY